MTVMEKLRNLSFPLIPLNKQNKPGDPAIDCQNKVCKITLFLLIYLNLRPLEISWHYICPSLQQGDCFIYVYCYH